MFPFDLLSAILACYCQQLNLNPNPPSECCLVTGAPVVGDCCAGFAWVRVLNIYPTRSFPALDQTPDRCIPPVWAMQVELGIDRCAPAICDTAGNPCCDSELVGVAQQLLDRDAMIRALYCCLPALDEPGAPRMDEILTGPWVANGAEGGCYSSTMTATIRFINAVAPLEES
jgi:hypothetical protein